MLKYKTKWFNKWAKRNRVTDYSLIESLENLANDLNAANLGGGLFKVRVKKYNAGKRGGFRTLIAYKEEDKAIFIYGFSKSEKDNLSQHELTDFKKLAKTLLLMRENEYTRQVKLGNFFHIKE